MELLAAKTIFYFMLAIFITTGLLYFKKGDKPVQWYLTLSPFILSGVLLSGFVTIKNDVVVFYTPVSFALGIVFCGLAIFVFGSALGSHSQKIPMWHQNNDMPERIKKTGAYFFVRHPFYTSYYLYYVGLFLSFPSTLMLINSIFGLIVLFITAKREEVQLLNDRVLGKEYREYMQVSGMLFPKLSMYLFTDRLTVNKSASRD